jgi:oxygen-independent coproporphyrinogen-3 oxidase
MMQASTPDIPLSLYLHFPWCVRKCPYCDFNSHALHAKVPEEQYVSALLRDLDFELQERETRPLTSIFMGGGTPSLFSDAAIGRVLEQLGKRLRLASAVEITLEANPGTADAVHFRGYRAAGVNRLSIGVQSLHAPQLKKLGRVHGPEEAISAYRIAREAGFENINLDLMFALPGQTLAEAESDIRALLALEPEHVSYYHLTLEPNTEFAAHPPVLPDEETAWGIQDAGQRALADQGYAQYEVSAYSRPDRHSRHNLNYWQFGDYLGIGAGAHGKRTQDGRVVRRARHRHPRTYLETAGTAAAVQEHKAIAESELPFEFCMNALRLNQGFALSEFQIRTGLPSQTLERPLQQARKLGLVEEPPGWIRASERGRAHLNALLRLFLK